MEKFALLVGVGEYGCPADFPGLPAAARNVAALKKVLGGGEKGNFKIAVPEDHTRAGVGEAIGQLFSGRDRNDVALLYFSGYLVRDRIGRFHLATRDTRRDGNGGLARASAIPVSLVRSEVRRSRCKSCILVLDVCFLGLLPEGSETDNNGPVDVHDQLGGQLAGPFGNKARIVLSVSGPEPAAFGQGEDPSPYTGALVEGMENWEADLNRNGRISVNEWHEFACEKIHGEPAMGCHAIGLGRKGRDIHVAEMPAEVFRERYAKEAGKFVTRQGKISSIGREELESWRRGGVLRKREFDAIEAEACEPCRGEFREKCERHARFIWEKMGENAGRPPSREAVLASRRTHGLMEREAEEIGRRIAGRYRQHQKRLKKYGKFYRRTIGQIPFPPPPEAPEAQERLRQRWEALGLSHGKLEMFGLEVELSACQDEEKSRIEEKMKREERQGRENGAAPDLGIHRLSIEREHVASFLIFVVILVFGGVISVLSGLVTIAPDSPDRFPWRAEWNRETAEIIAPSAEPAVHASAPDATAVTGRENAGAAGSIHIPGDIRVPIRVPGEPHTAPAAAPGPEPEEGRIAQAPAEKDTAEAILPLVIYPENPEQNDQRIQVPTGSSGLGMEQLAMETGIPGAIAMDDLPMDDRPAASVPGPLEPGPDGEQQTQPEENAGPEPGEEKIAPEPETETRAEEEPALIPVPPVPDYDKWRVLSKIQAHSGAVCRSGCIAFSPDGRAVLSGSHDGLVKLWDAKTGELKPGRAFQGHSGPIHSVAFAPDGRAVLSGGYDTTLRRWDVKSGGEPEIFRGHAYGVTSVAFSPDGGMILSGSWDDTVKLWDVESGGAKVKTLRVEGSRDANSAAFSPDGRMILSGSGDGRLRLWHMDGVDDIPWNGRNDLKPYRTFMGHTLPVLSVAFSPDGKTALSGSRGRIFKLWDVESGERIHTFWGHSAAIRSVAFSPDGKTVLSGSGDRTLKLWDVASGQIKRTLNGHAHEVHSVAFSPDGRRAASGDKSGAMILWGPEAPASRE